MRLSRQPTISGIDVPSGGEFMLRKNALSAVYVTTHAVLLGSDHGDPQAEAAGEKRPISIENGGRAIPNTLEEIVDPTHTAVIVHEMVRDLVA